VKAKFIAEFILPDGGIKESSQTGFALAFAMDLLPEEVKAKATEKFVEEIKKKDWHLATGFVGTSKLLPALTRAGKTDVAYRLLMNQDFPSWLYQVKLGATTMWERWDGWRPDKGFQDAGMNSFNHYAFGAVGEWLFHTSGGIDIGSPGFKTIVIKPQPGGGLTHAKATYDSINGRIVSGWKIEGGKLAMAITIPPNTTATIHVPTTDPNNVTEGGKSAADAQGVRFVEMKNGAAIYEVGSGRYHFATK
jgi:alpha-L-rhamnosidase